MVQFTVTILQFSGQGEKTGWTYIKIPKTQAQRIKAGQKKSFRVKGKLDCHHISSLALIPVGGGDFIMALNANIRKLIKKGKGDSLIVLLEVDNKPLKLSVDLMECLKDEPKALSFFNSLPKSHQHYFSKWIEAARTEATKANRIAQTVNSLSKGFHFGQMLRANKKDKEIF